MNTTMTVSGDSKSIVVDLACSFGEAMYRRDPFQRHDTPCWRGESDAEHLANRGYSRDSERAQCRGRDLIPGRY